MEPKIIHLPTSVIAGINRHCGVELHKIFHQPNGEFKHGWFKTKKKKAQKARNIKISKMHQE